MIEPQSLAANFYFSEILDKVRTLEEAFDKLYVWDRHHTTLESTLRLWRSLKISQFKTEQVTWTFAMEKFCERATLVQAQLDPIQKHDTHLIEVLQTGIRDQPFYMFVERSESAASAHQYFQNCLSAIAKEEDMESTIARQEVERRFLHTSGLLRQTDSVRNSSSFPSTIHPPVFPVGSTQPALMKPSTVPSASEGKRVKQENVIREALFSRTGRRYGKARNTRRQNGKNPIGRDGKRMLCRGCDADDHFIAQCPKHDKAKLVAFATDVLGSDAFEFSSNDILDMVQDIPDDIWEVFLSNCVEIQDDEKSNTEEMEPKEALFAKLADNSAVHEFIGKKALTRFPLLEDLKNDDKPQSLDDDSKEDTLRLSYNEFQSSLCETPSHQISKPRSPLKILTSSRVPSLSPVGPTEHFEGIMLDNGASGTPSGLPAYLRYCKHVEIKPRLCPSQNSFVGIGNGIVRSLGLATTRMPPGNTTFLDFETDIVPQDVPLIFGLDQHRKHGCSSDEYQNTFTHHPSNTTIPVKFKRGHLYIEWPTFEALFTKVELKKLHDRFGHPTSKSLINLLKRARPKECDAGTRKILRDLEIKCKSCQTFSPKPAVYKVSMPMEDIVFNHEIGVDLFWIEGKAILHIIDRGTRYSVARFIKSQTAEYLWNMIIDAWVTVFTGFSNAISHDRGSQFSSAFFGDACAGFGIIAKEAPTESHNSLSLCERYHPIIRRVFRKLKHDHPDLDRHLILSLAVHVVNTTTGPDGLTPSLFVFGTIPKLPRGGLKTIPSTQKERFKAMKTAREEMLATTAERRLAAALKQRKPRAQQFIPKEGDSVRVYRENSERVEGPYPVHSYDQRKMVWVEARDAAGRLRIVPFSLSQVRPFREEHDPQSNVISELEAIQQQQLLPEEGLSPLIEPASTAQASSGPDILGTDNLEPSDDALPLDAFPVQIVNDSHDERFDQAKIDELRQLLNKRTYRFVSESKVSDDAVVLDSRFVLSIKNPETSNPHFKARIVVLGHKDPDKGRIVNEAPTVLRSSIRLVIALSQIFGYRLWTRDVSQAFVQSNDVLKRELYIRPPRNEHVLEILGAPEGSLLKVIQPLYGLPESPTYWWSTFSEQHRKVLNMSPCALDPCRFFRRNDDDEFDGAQAVLVDDTIGTGTNSFAKNETLTEKHFRRRPVLRPFQ